jgi:hypothetical protein
MRKKDIVTVFASRGLLKLHPEIPEKSPPNPFKNAYFIDRTKALVVMHKMQERYPEAKFRLIFEEMTCVA